MGILLRETLETALGTLSTLRMSPSLEILRWSPIRLPQDPPILLLLETLVGSLYLRTKAFENSRNEACAD